MYKGLTGWKEADEKHRATHMLLSMAEYNTLCNERNQAIRDRNAMMTDAKRFKEKAETEANRRVRIANEEADKKVNDMSEELAKERREREYQEGLNENLLRINKERNNAERKLSPKREHSGYVVLSSQEKEVRYAVRRGTASYTAWETVIQSPYKIDFSEDQARKLIDEDLTPDDGKWILGKIGITSYWYTDLADIIESEDFKNKNLAFQKRLRANYKAGYWEVIYLHNKALDGVPKEMRAK